MPDFVLEVSEERHRFENGKVSDPTELEERVTDENKLRKVGQRYIIRGRESYTWFEPHSI